MNMLEMLVRASLALQPSQACASKRSSTANLATGKPCISSLFAGTAPKVPYMRGCIALHCIEICLRHAAQLVKDSVEKPQRSCRLQ
ncbi:hypothetical protein CERZMDRAFT_90972 [Cercospora zeae-maydis SCOH1-5]|uniref:Uncharacterized protein n=1 Tax=Cercospora zeae-maydis SCOH1-5 TaxID=717836 RepID=A0A6A6FD50_9PEZI|nr:hypothetical protein CERZMDRAFT_90972 [Cercospora zeae-maydis SCOH1-5]